MSTSCGSCYLNAGRLAGHLEQIYGAATWPAAASDRQWIATACSLRSRHWQLGRTRVRGRRTGHGRDVRFCGGRLDPRGPGRVHCQCVCIGRDREIAADHARRHGSGLTCRIGSAGLATPVPVGTSGSGHDPALGRLDDVGGRCGSCVTRTPDRRVMKQAISRPRPRRPGMLKSSRWRVYAGRMSFRSPNTMAALATTTPSASR